MIKVTGNELDLAYMRWHVTVLNNTNKGPFWPARTSFMRFLSGDPVPLDMGHKPTGGHWDLSAEGGRRVKALCSEHWYTLLRAMLVHTERI